MTGESSLLYDSPLVLVVIVAAIIMWVAYFFGVYASNYYLKGKDAKADIDEIKSANEGLAIMGFIFLLLGFTFSISLSRYDARRTIIYEEANNIGTAILRADLYPDSARMALRKDFKEYVEARIAYYESQKNGREAIYRALSQSDSLSGRIWNRAIRLSHEQPNVVRDGQMIPALNAMIDISTARDAARLARVPDEIIYLLLISVAVGGFVAGYDKKSWVVMALFTTLTLMTFYTIIDLDHSMRGLIRSDLTHTKMVKLREMFR